jgi:hypothetical protein
MSCALLGLLGVDPVWWSTAATPNPAAATAATPAPMPTRRAGDTGRAA